MCKVVHNFTKNGELQTDLLRNFSLFLHEVETIDPTFKVFGFKSKGPLERFLNEFELKVAVDS